MGNMMAKKTKRDKPEMTDAEYAEFQELQHYDAASLRALALWLNQKKRNAALMKAVSAEMGRNARHLARAVDYFPPYFDVTGPYRDLATNAADYLKLFEYAKLKREAATELFARHKFALPIYILRETIKSANGNGAAHKPSLAEQVADIRNYFSSKRNEYTAAYDAIDDFTNALDALLAVRSALARREAK